MTNAILLAEDRNFFSHFGVDIPGIGRSFLLNTLRQAWLSKPMGASTITQQVAKNLLALYHSSAQRSLQQKAKEMILAFRLESSLTKEKILEIYLNEIYFGNRSYGVVAAAKSYFKKELTRLNAAETAFLAALPKAPSYSHNPGDLSKLRQRASWILSQLHENGFLSATDCSIALEELRRLTVKQSATTNSNVDYFIDAARRISLNAVDLKAPSIKTTLNSALQELVVSTLRSALLSYEKKLPWRGPFASITSTPQSTLLQELRKIQDPPALLDWQLAVVSNVSPKKITLLFKDGHEQFVEFNKLKWILGQGPPEKIIPVGSVIPVSKDENWECQIPKITGGIVVMDIYTGQVLALTGGYSYDLNCFDYVTQAQRQPGSAFKPFVYLAALENGLQPTTVVSDAPLLIRNSATDYYAPKNYGKKYAGLISLQAALELSKNVSLVRIAQLIGMKAIEKIAVRLGLSSSLPHNLSTVLGSSETTLLRLTTAYAIIANGGFYIRPTFVPLPFQKNPQRVISLNASQKVMEMLQGVVSRGTGALLKEITERYNLQIAGKTGTTNESKDVLFVGLSGRLAIGISLGYPIPQSLGKRATGSVIAAPIFKELVGKMMAEKKLASLLRQDRKTL